MDARCPNDLREQYARSLLQGASELFRARADIEFRVATFGVSGPMRMPAGATSDVVDDAGYHFLAAVHRAAVGPRVLLVDRVSRTELGGEARSQTRVCLIAYGSDPAATSRMLAHELGHLLELPHVDGARQAGPGHEREIAAWMRNLMYSGALHPDAELTPDQVTRARTSALGRRFGGK